MWPFVPELPISLRFTYVVCNSPKTPKVDKKYCNEEEKKCTVCDTAENSSSTINDGNSSSSDESASSMGFVLSAAWFNK